MRAFSLGGNSQLKINSSTLLQTSLVRLNYMHLVLTVHFKLLKIFCLIYNSITWIADIRCENVGRIPTINSTVLHFYLLVIITMAFMLVQCSHFLNFLNYIFF